MHIDTSILSFLRIPSNIDNHLYMCRIKTFNVNIFFPKLILLSCQRLHIYNYKIHRRAQARVMYSFVLVHTEMAETST